MEFLNIIWNFINNLTVSEVISYLIGIVGILLSIVFYYRSKRTQEPRFIKSSAVITEEMISKNSLIHIMFGEQRLQRLTMTKVVFWNTGITLKSEDVSKNSPFRLELKGDDYQFIDCSLIYAEEENGVNCTLSEDKKTILLPFDYLAKNQGFVIKALHTGKGSGSVEVKGAMKNEGKLRKTVPLIASLNSFLYQNVSSRMQNIVQAWTFIILGLIAIVYSLFEIGSKRESLVISINDIIPALVAGILIIIVGLLFKVGFMPKKLHKAFWEEF